MAEWYESHDNLCEMARRMADDGAEAGEIVSFFEQPWKWTREWEHRDRHAEACIGIRNCEFRRCDQCSDDTLGCLIALVEIDDDDFDLCPACREASAASKTGGAHAA